MGRVIRCRRRCDDGFTLVEVVLAIAILSVAIAASAAGLSLAASARSTNDERSLAIEIANEALQQAEAFGCGLPVDYNGVSAEERLDACDYNGTETGGAALADVDYTTARDGRSFDVEIRMRWHSIRPVDTTYTFTPTIEDCELRQKWNANDQTGSGTQPSQRSDPTLLSRTVTVTTPDGTTVAIDSTEAVLDTLAGTNHQAFLYLRGYSGERAYVVQDSLAFTGGDTNPDLEVYKYELHADTNDCAVFAFLAENTDYKTRYYQSGSLNTPTKAAICTPGPCSLYSDRPT